MINCRVLADSQDRARKQAAKIDHRANFLTIPNSKRKKYSLQEEKRLEKSTIANKKFQPIFFRIRNKAVTVLVE